MLSSNLRSGEVQSLSYQIGYRKHLFGMRFDEADPEDTELSYDSDLTLATENQIGYLEKCSDSDTDFVREYYNVLCVLDDCVNTGEGPKKDSALMAYKKICFGIDSAVGSLEMEDFVPDNTMLDYIKKISGLKVTVRLSEIVI